MISPLEFTRADCADNANYDLKLNVENIEPTAYRKVTPLERLLLDKTKSHVQADSLNEEANDFSRW